MSAADVVFLTISGELCAEDEKPARFTFRCVKGNNGRDPALYSLTCAMLLIAPGLNSSEHGIKRDPQGLNGGRPQWDWDGNKESPTFTPSVDCSKHCGWHGYIRNGRCVSTSGVDEP